MAQGDYIELHQKRNGKRFDHDERSRKKEARSGHKLAAIAKRVRGLKAKQFNKKRYAEKAEMKKTIKQHQERLNKHKSADAPADKDAVPAYLLDREVRALLLLIGHPPTNPMLMCGCVYYNVHVNLR